MKNCWRHISRKVTIIGAAVFLAAAITLACGVPSSQLAQKAPPKLAHNEDRASLAYPILKRRGPLTAEELRNGAAPVVVKHRPIHRSKFPPTER